MRCLWALLLASAVAARAGDTLPEGAWDVAEPADAGLDPVALTDLVHLIDSGVNFPNVHAVLISHNGQLIFEHYREGDDGEHGTVEHGPHTLHDIRSISKSVISLILGVALETSTDEHLSQSITEFFPDREITGEAPGTVTLEHVLTMTAGLSWNESIIPYTSNNDYVRLVSNADPVGFVLAKDVRYPPGSQWTYNSGLTEITAGVIENLTGKSLADFADEVLFGPLGIQNYEWWRPPAWPLNHAPSAASGLRMTARDLAKIASLVLHDGKWREHPIVQAAWVAAATTRQFDIPNSRYGYGYFWFVGELPGGEPAIQASGWGGQHIFVLPEAGLTITVLAGNYEDGGGAAGERIADRIARAMLRG